MNEWYNFLTYLPLDKANWEFKASTNLTPPIVLYYSGLLKASPEAHHLLLVSQINTQKTTDFQGRVMPRPQYLNNKVSHDFSCIVEPISQPPQRDLLFHFQINGSDITAKQLTYTLVETMKQANPVDKRYLLDSKYKSLWAGLAENKLYQLNVEHQVWLDPNDFMA
ncbi:hypothetical protein [Synechocystis sp. LKSZ1]|uniref:hypothetical protein n=1 Tax=Synechocystis sp. LKSZ1 TaxID=3144951 RepID=UPI00336C068C